MNYTHVIWDFDGTLFDSYPAMASAFCDALGERGISEPEETILSLMKVSMGHAIRHYQEEHPLDEAFFERYKALRKTAEAQRMLPFGGAFDLCRAICLSGGRNYLFTHRGKSAVASIEKFGLHGYFTEMITSKQDFPRKPNPDAILYLMQKHGFKKDEAIMIGDREIDLLAAKNAGIHSCYLSEGSMSLDSADVTIRSLVELYQVLGIETQGCIS